MQFSSVLKRTALIPEDNKYALKEKYVILETDRRRCQGYPYVAFSIVTDEAVLSNVLQCC